MNHSPDTTAGPQPHAVVNWREHAKAQTQEFDLAAAAARSLLEEGVQGPALAMLSKWAFAAKLDWSRAVLRAVLERPPLVLGLDLTRWGAPCLDVDQPKQARFLHRRHAWSQATCSQSAAHSPVDATTWALEALSWIGARIDAEERLAWTTPVQEAPHDDACCMAVWASLIAGDVWSVHDTLSGDWARAATRGFRAGLRARGVPETARRQYIAEFRESVLFYLLGANDETPGWHDVAARTLEWTGPSAVASLGERLNANGWRRAITCPKSRTPAWRAVRAQVAGELANSLAQDWALENAARNGDLPLEAVVDLLVALRLLSSLHEADAPPPSPDRLWAVALHHRHRTRGRLRAIVSGSLEGVVEAFSGLDGLQARTHQSLRQFGWARACEVVRGQGLPDWMSPVTPACTNPEAMEPRLSADERAAVETWILLCVVRGRRRELEHWGTTGQWLKRPDSGWGRLLQQGLPGSLVGEDRAYRRIVAHLCLYLPEHQAALADRVRQLSRLSNTRDLKAALALDWHPSISFPSRLSRSAQAALSEAAVAWEGA